MLLASAIDAIGSTFLKWGVAPCAASLAPSSDGRLALLSILPHDQPQLWLLDGERGAARQLTAGLGGAAAISPDGALVAAGALTKANDRLNASYRIESIDGATTVSSGSGLPIAWLQP